MSKVFITSSTPLSSKARRAIARLPESRVQLNAAFMRDVDHDMPSGDISQFLWSDAWLFLAFGLAASGEPAPLGSALPLADGIQHAIPTKEEVDGALARLTRAGYVAYAKGYVTITPTGRALLREAEIAGSGLLTRQKALEHLLVAASRTASYDPRAAGRDEPEVVSGEDWARAIARYRS